MIRGEMDYVSLMKQPFLLESDQLVNMNGRTTYQAAIEAAPIVEAHFARQLIEAKLRGETNLAPKPEASTIEAIVDATLSGRSLDQRKDDFRRSR